ncbi:MAG: aspartate aminotransferase family protein, partial [Candidatus Eremiobacteraeota bacterium]|nr:aspartate aminotransferase family protein [Candidatus Eremiobacteraeota bacterium]
MNGDGELEHIATAIPGPQTAAQIPTLQRYESRNVTHFADDFPIVWESASGATVVDVDGNRYLDLTAAFGVANTGHANPRVIAAVTRQAARLMHAMGDVHPSEVRTRLLERLAQIFPGVATKAFLATTGSEAVEAALKTAMLATGRTRFASFRGAYHGLSLGTLQISGIEKFRKPFAAALAPDALQLDFPSASVGVDANGAIATTRASLQGAHGIAAVVIEPIQGRGGCVVPPDGYLTALRALCDELGALLVVDEIFTGFGRTGTWFAVDREGVVPDILCIGKAMGSGFPISAIVAKAEIMDAWPVSMGEALHTSTYLGNPMGCAAALATFDEMQARELPERAAGFEPLLRDRLG